MLSLAFVVIAGLLIAGELQQRISGVREIDPAEATKMINRDKAVLLDIRDTAEYKDGLLPDAVAIPAAEIQGRLGEIEKFRDRPVIAYCGHGNVSKKICSLLRKSGFDAVFNLRGGMNAWRQANMPVRKSS